MTIDRPLLRQPEIRALLGARLANALALSALATVVAYQTYITTHDPLSLGWLGLVEAIPAVSLSLLGGHLADRRDRRSLVLIGGGVMVLCAAALAVLAQTGSSTLPAILGVIFVTGVAVGFERPARMAFEMQVIPRSQMVRGASLASSMSQAGSILGPAVAGFALAIFGIPATYLGIGILLAIALGCLALIPRKPVPEPIAGEPLRQALLGGIRFVAGSPILLGSMALDLFAVFFGGAAVLLPIFATDILHVGTIGLGLLRTAPSVGVLAVMLVATRRPPTRNAGRILLLCVAGFGLSMIVFGLSTSFLLSLVALFFAGLTDGVNMIIRITIMRVMSPERLRGRVAAVGLVFISGSNELGEFESGVAARLLGTVPSVVAGAILTLGVVGLVAFLVPDLRRLHLEEARAPDEVPVAA